MIEKMAIEKMKLLSITGPEKELDRFIARNLLDTNIQVEDAKKIYKLGNLNIMIMIIRLRIT